MQVFDLAPPSGSSSIGLIVMCSQVLPRVPDVPGSVNYGGLSLQLHRPVTAIMAHEKVTSNGWLVRIDFFRCGSTSRTRPGTFGAMLRERGERCVCAVVLTCRKTHVS